MSSKPRKVRWSRFVAGVAVWSGLALCSAAQATNGYLIHGIGTRAKATAGAGVALPQDALASAVNPAGLVFVGDHKDVGIALFSPHREYTVEGTPSGYPGTFGLTPGTVKSDSEYFPVPNAGFSWSLGPDAAWGIAIYGQGGMNTNYPTATFYGSSPTGVDLAQLFVVPTYSKRLGGRNAVGISPILAVQRFRMQGVQAFGMFSQDPAHLSNQGYDMSNGYGVRVGYLGKWTDNVSVGVSYQSKIQMGNFDKYRGLFAEDGGFDIPSNWSAGVGLRITHSATLAFDTQQIHYSDIKSVGSPLLPNLMQAPLGSASGPGFGWRDMTVYKLGLVLDSGGPWAWRFGASTGKQPIRSSEVMFNILAPGVMEEHYTFGFSRRLANGRECNLAFMYAPAVEVSGPNPLEAPGQQTIRLKMSQWDLEFGYSW